MTTRRWIYVAAVLVGILLLISEHNSRSTDSGTSGSNGTRPCTVTVTADVLQVRSSPDGDAPVVGSYDKGAVVSADRTTQNGFRQLGTDRWAAQDFLDPTPDSDCG